MLLFSLPYRKTASMWWGMIFHHVMVFAAYTLVVARRRLAWCACP
jgi:hypothetical protein